jgi:hypothetical protein
MFYLHVACFPVYPVYPVYLCVTSSPPVFFMVLYIVINVHYAVCFVCVCVRALYFSVLEYECRLNDAVL